MTGTEILFTILGGVGLLLWGCRMVRTGVMRGFGPSLISLVGVWSSSRLRAAAVGTVVGTLLQSATATALLVSPFVGQGAILTASALAVMLGADLGSAIAALVFSSGVSASWPVFAFVGYVVHVGFGERNLRAKNIGRILIGLGLLFLGLRTIAAAASDLSSSQVIFGAIEAAANEPFLALLAGALLTWIAYSSVAIVLFAMALASASGLSAEHLFAFVLGINLGAALPALSATLSEAPAARRVPVGNLIFRVAGVAIVLAAYGPATGLIAGLSQSAGTQIILFHLCFNAALIPVFIGLVGPIGRLLQRWLPDLVGQDTQKGPRYLDESLIRTPSAALGAASRETLRMGEIIEGMLAKTMEVFNTGNTGLIAAVDAAEDQLDTINEAMKLYVTRLMREELSEEDIARAVDIVTYTTNLEHVGDIIDRNLMELAAKKARLNVEFSEQGHADIQKMHSRVMDTLNLSLNVFTSGQADSARALVMRKTELRALELEGNERHLERLRSGKFESMVTSAIHLDVIRDLKRINSHLASVAYPVLERAGELRTTRLTKESEQRAQPAEK